MIITLCGSTRFRDDFHRVNALLSLHGHLVISVGLFGHADGCLTCGHPAEEHFHPNPRSLAGDAGRGRCCHVNEDGTELCRCPAYRVLDEAEKNRLDALHLRKIELADAVFVVNPGAYIGDSTAREVVHAQRLHKPVYLLHQGDLDTLTNPEIFPR